MPQDIFNIEDLSRDLAGQYAQGRLSTDEYLTLWKEITRAHVSGNNQKHRRRMTKKEQQAEQYRQQRLKAEAAIVARRVKFEQDINRMRDNGDLDRCAKLLSMAYQVFTQANSFAEEAVSLMEQYGVIHKKAKTAANNLMQSFDAFDKVMSDMIKNGGSSNPQSAFDQLCFDTEMLSIILYGFMDNNIEVKRGPYLSATLFLPEKKH